MRRKLSAFRKPAKLTWVPVFVTSREGRRVILTGTARTRLSNTITAPQSVRATDLQGEPIGRLESITNDGGSLKVSFILDPDASDPDSKFLLGLLRQGRHVCRYLSAAEPRAEDAPPQEYPGMLGEVF